MSLNVHLYDNTSEATSYGNYDTIQEAINYALDQEISNVFIKCDENYTGEIGAIHDHEAEIEAITSAGIKILGGNVNFTDDFLLCKDIQLGPKAKVSNTGYIITDDGDIELGSGAVMLAGTTISAAGTIEVGSDAKMSAANEIVAEGGDIVVSSGAKVLLNAADPSTPGSPFTGIKLGEEVMMSAGASIRTAGGIQLASGASVYTSEGNIVASGADGIMLEDDARMYAGSNGSVSATAGKIVIGDGAVVSASSSVFAQGGIQLASGAAVYTGEGEIDANGADGITLGENAVMSAYSEYWEEESGNISATAGKIDVSAGALMSAITTIYAAEEITVANGAKVFINAYDYSFTGIMLGESATMSAGTSIQTDDDIEVHNGATMSAGDSIQAAGNVDIKNGAVIKAASIEADTIRNDGTIKLDAGSTLKVTTGVSGLDATGVIRLDLTTLGSTYSDDLYLLVDGTIDDETVDIHVNGESSPLEWADIKAGNYRFGPSSEYSLLASDEDDPTKLYLIKDTASTLFVNSDYSSTSGIWTDDGHLTGYNAFNNVAATIQPTTTALIVTGGEFTTANAPTFNGVATTILGGAFSTSVCGGTFFTDEAGDVEGDITISVQNTLDELEQVVATPIFNKIFFAGDRIHGNDLEQTRTGDITTTISGGLFNNAVAGAMAFTGTFTNSEAILDGSVSLTITGGQFLSGSGTNKDWIYGGAIATNKENAGNTHILGDVTVTLDASDNDITVGNLVAGSYGMGEIDGNATLVLTGDNNVTATGEIWGGCSSDTYTTEKIGHNRLLESAVGGERILSFTGFNGTLTSEKNKIWAFRDIEVKEFSDATIANSDAEAAVAKGGAASINLSDVINWTFECGSRLTGDFINDFNGDTLILKDFDAAPSGNYILMISDSNAIFNGFGELGSIWMGDSLIEDANYGENAWTWSDNAFTLAITDVEINEQTFKAMQFTIA